jgi:hypothetical protein
VVRAVVRAVVLPVAMLVVRPWGWLVGRSPHVNSCHSEPREYRHTRIWCTLSAGSFDLRCCPGLKFSWYLVAALRVVCVAAMTTRTDCWGRHCLLSVLTSDDCRIPEPQTSLSLSNTSQRSAIRINPSFSQRQYAIPSFTSSTRQGCLEGRSSCYQYTLEGSTRPNQKGNLETLFQPRGPRRLE